MNYRDHGRRGGSKRRHAGSIEERNRLCEGHLARFDANEAGRRGADSNDRRLSRALGRGLRRSAGAHRPKARSFTYRELDARANRYARWALARGLAQGRRGLPDDAQPAGISRDLDGLRARRRGDGADQHQSDRSFARPLRRHRRRQGGDRRDLTETAIRRRATSICGADLAVFVHGEAAGGEKRIDEEVETFSAAPLAAHERPALTIDDSALFIFTSGTTGLPKAARITHSRALRIMFGFAAAANARAEDRMYNCLPMYHTNGGVIASGVALSVGGSCYIRERFSASEFWSDAIRHDCTMFIYVGELCRYLLNTPPSAKRSRASNPSVRRQRAAAGYLRRVPGSASPFATCSSSTPRPKATSRCSISIRIPARSAGCRAGRPSAFRSRPSPSTSTTNVEKRDARGHCIECGVDEPGELLGEIRDDPKSRRRASTATPIPRPRGRKSCATCSSRATRGFAPATS